MTKTRITIPRDIREKVQVEFNHRCAICGADKPHLHHIDENPSNNDPMNLIPLCPNCHLVDQHDPTRGIDFRKLSLFREYKDPTILQPQFHPLYMRIRFLDSIKDDSELDSLVAQAEELVDFVAVLEMGTFYSKKLNELTKRPNRPGALLLGGYDPRAEYEEEQRRRQDAHEYREQLRQAKQQVYSLIIELLRFQKWK